MKDTDLFQMGLGLQSPWFISSSEFKPEAKELHLEIDFTPGASFICPSCSNEGCPVHDSKEKVWRHLNFWEHKTYLKARSPRVKCSECGVKTISPPWARSDSGFTLLFEALIIKLAESMPVNAIAKLVGEQDTRLWRVIRRYVNEEYEKLDFSHVTKVGFDETSQKRGHNYITVAVDLDEGKVLHVTEGRDQTTIKSFKDEVIKHGGDPNTITDVSIDMSPAYIAGVESHLPKSDVTFDKFHVIKMLNSAVDAVRRAESKEFDVLKGSRYVWLKNQSNLTSYQNSQLQEILGLPQMNLKTVRAYKIKLAFQDFYRQSPDVAEAYLKKWYWWATHSRIEQIKEFAYAVKRHWNGILQWFESKVTNGVLEGTNSLIQEIKARARGFKNVHNFIAVIYLKLSGICSPQPT